MRSGMKGGGDETAGEAHKRPAKPRRWGVSAPCAGEEVVVGDVIGIFFHVTVSAHVM
jgi:hypothetical protein